jgi:uncharacterized membrane protein YkvA (DUF1232 family)
MDVVYSLWDTCSRKCENFIKWMTTCFKRISFLFMVVKRMLAAMDRNPLMPKFLIIWIALQTRIAEPTCF